MKRLTEDNITPSVEGAFTTCPDPECTLTPTVSYFIKEGECICGHPVTIYMEDGKDE